MTKYSTERAVTIAGIGPTAVGKGHFGKLLAKRIPELYPIVAEHKLKSDDTANEMLGTAMSKRPKPGFTWIDGFFRTRNQVSYAAELGLLDARDTLVVEFCATEKYCRERYAERGDDAKFKDSYQAYRDYYEEVWDGIQRTGAQILSVDVQPSMDEVFPAIMHQIERWLYGCKVVAVNASVRVPKLRLRPTLLRDIGNTFAEA